MTSEVSSKIELGLSPLMDCSYLSQEQEKLLFVLDPRAYNEVAYEALLGQGFRRSGEDIYRPHCPSCSACRSIRLIAEQFTPSKSQQRILKKCSHLEWRMNWSATEHHYPLYARYIEARHKAGSMYPPSPQHFKQFTQTRWMQQIYLEAWLDGELVVVAVTDLMPNSLSALYTFFAPELAQLSFGTAAILKQIELCQTLKKEVLYLGYQIDACPAMNYKNRFKPHQLYVDSRWQEGNS